MESLTFFKILMLQKKLSNKDVAKELGVSEVSVKDWIDGKKNIPYKRLDELKKVLEIDNPDLLSEKMRLPTPEEMGLVGDTSVENVITEKKTEQIIWQPVGSDLRNFYSSILSEKVSSPPVSTKDMRLEPVREEVELIESGFVSVWGVQDGNNYMTFNKFQRIQKGDIVMFYSAQKFIAYGTIVGKIISEDLSMELWKSHDFKNIYIIKDVRPMDEEYSEWTKQIYGKASRSLQGLRILDEEKSKHCLKILGQI
ncbi:helix-turn-helix domain-containing protein [Exiguobacterium profundum]|uniref:helix-turn-helix domain-containing protein n=1 Tax=Exiguobacterium profundum TaxID=307643 RepID=UPI00093B1975|nr:helix-turn-helix transcriptional regulator [Exiguobacterium profundum]